MSNNKKGTKQSNFLVDFIIAGSAAAVGKTATAPLERVKLLLQNQVAICVIDQPYKGINDCLVRLVKHEGFFALWRGNVTNVIRYFPNQAFNFAFKDTFKQIFCPYDPKKNFWKFAFGSCLSGGLAGSLSLLGVHPIDLARTRLATDNKNKDGNRKFKGAIDCLKQIFQSEGVKGIYKGIGVSVIGIFTYRAAYFGGYDILKGVILKPNSNFFTKWFAAQMVTIVSGMCFYPLDTIRRRMMLQSGEAIPKYTDSWDCIRKMRREERFIGFYKGFMTNALKTSGSSVILVLYDEVQKYLGYEARGGVKE